MSRMQKPTLVLAAAFLAGLLAGCGKQGPLEQPAPLFGQRAKAQYEAAQKAQEARDDAQRAGQSGSAQSGARGPIADQPDNTPITTRDIRDPSQRLSPASQAPIPGAPDPLGRPVSTVAP